VTHCVAVRHGLTSKTHILCVILVVVGVVLTIMVSDPYITTFGIIPVTFASWLSTLYVTYSAAIPLDSLDIHPQRSISN